MNHCANAGFLVGATRELPTDTTDFQWGSRLPSVGCNRLRCSVCGALVHQQPGWLVNRDQVQFGTLEYQSRIDEMYERQAWSELPWMRPYDAYRVYVCHCGFVTEDNELAIGLSTAGGPGDGTIPWRCDGHDEVSLPFVIDGVTFADGKAVLAAARKALGGWQPAAVAQETYGTWVNRLHGRLKGTELAPRIERLTVEALRDPDPRMREGALRFLTTHRNPDGFREAATLALDGATDPVEAVQNALIDAVARIYEYEVLDEPRLRDWARMNALKSGVRPTVIEALAERDSQWLRDSAEAIVRANPQEAGFVLKSVFNAFGAGGYTPFELAARLARIPGDSHEHMRADARRWLRGVNRDGVIKILDTLSGSAN